MRSAPAWRVSDDLKTKCTLSPKAPLLTSPHSSQSLRYIDAQEGGGDLNVFYEFRFQPAREHMNRGREDATAGETKPRPRGAEIG